MYLASSLNITIAQLINSKWITCISDLLYSYCVLTPIMSNSTNKDYIRFISRVGYTGEGFGLVVFDGLIVLVILWSSHCGIAKNMLSSWVLLWVTWLWMGFGFMTAGIRRLYLEITDTHTMLVNQFDCFLKINNLCWIFAIPTSAFMMTVISVDRLFAVTFPMKY